MIKAGKKTNEWNRIRSQLKIQFQAKGITSCEIMFTGCWADNGLGFAHIDKRRYLTPEELRTGVVLACNFCHDIVEKWEHTRMRDYLQSIINQRSNYENKYQVIGGRRA